MSEIENIAWLDMAFQVSPGYVKIKSKYAVLFPQSEESPKAKSSSLIYFSISSMYFTNNFCLTNYFTDTNGSLWCIIEKKEDCSFVALCVESELLNWMLLTGCHNSI